MRIVAPAVSQPALIPVTHEDSTYELYRDAAAADEYWRHKLAELVDDYLDEHYKFAKGFRRETLFETAVDTLDTSDNGTYWSDEGLELSESGKAELARALALAWRRECKRTIRTAKHPTGQYRRTPILRRARGALCGSRRRPGTRRTTSSSRSASRGDADGPAPPGGCPRRHPANNRSAGIVSWS